MEVKWSAENQGETPIRLLAEKSYSVGVSLGLRRAVPQRVPAPRFKKPKNYSYFVFLEDDRKNIIAWKRVSVTKQTVVKLDFVLSTGTTKTITVCVLCDSFLGIEVEQNFEVEVVGSVEVMETVEERENVDLLESDELNPEEFEEDEEFDEYLLD